MHDLHHSAWIYCDIQNTRTNIMTSTSAQVLICNEVWILHECNEECVIVGRGWNLGKFMYPFIYHTFSQTRNNNAHRWSENMILILLDVFNYSLFIVMQVQWWNPQWGRLQNDNKNCMATFAIHVETNRKYITYYTYIAVFKPMFSQKVFSLNIWPWYEGAGCSLIASHSRIVKRDGDMIIKSL